MATRKGWTFGTLERLGVGYENGRFTIPTAAGVLRYADDGSKPKMLAANGSTRELWPAPEDQAGDVLVVVEGEPDAISAAELGFAATALPGAGKVDPLWPARLATGRRTVALVCDADAVGRTRMKSMAEQVAKVGGNAVLIDLAPERTDGYDLGDMLVELGPERTRATLSRALGMATPYVLEAPVASVPADNGREIVVVNMASVTPRNLEYLWHPYLPLGKVVIVAGAPGHGKSQLTALLAGLATRGDFYPSAVETPSRVLMLTAEDDLEDTVVPRLMAVNADLRLVDTINVKQTNGSLSTTGMIRIPGDVETIHAYVKAHPDTRLVTLDPVASFFGREHSTFVNQDVRDALDPLVAIAAQFRLTVVVVLHLNKSESRDFANRIADSYGFQALARCVLALGPDPADSDGERGSLKVLAVTKANLARAGNHAMRCEVRGATVRGADGEDIETSELVLTGKAEISADDLLMPASERTMRMEASEWLADFVGDRWVKTADVRKAALSDGLSWRTVERVRQAEDYRRAKQPGVAHGQWWIARQDCQVPTPPPGGVGDLADLQDSNPANAARGRDSQLAFLDDNPAKDANDANTARDENDEISAEWSEEDSTKLDQYRRERDRRLGEDDDDD